MKNTIMHKIILISLIFLMAVTLFACAKEEDTGPTPTPEITAEPFPFVEDVQLNTYNDFAISLLKNIRSQANPTDESEDTADTEDEDENEIINDNVIISPINVGVALTMLHIGALGDTQDGIEEALKLQLGDPTQLTVSSKALMDSLVDQQGAEFADGYSLYINEGPTIREDFAVRMEDYFRLDLNFNEFDDDRLEVYLNDWASEITSSSARITTIFSDNYISHDISTFMLSVSTVDCVWETAFNMANTRTLPFTSDSGMALAVPTLRGKMTIGFYEDENVTVGFLPLEGEKTTLAIFIPPDDDPIDKFLTKFSGDDIALWKNLAYKKEKWLYIPKINFAEPNVIELSEVLSNMGTDEMFDSEKADFTNLGSNFYLDDFYQVSQIRITETGANESDIEPVDITRANNNGEDFFIVNRSFIFAILDEETGGILMIGTLANPIEP